jgi:predicted TIM-barrel fold metal-dependent hydrolase
MDVQGIDQVMIIPTDIDTYPWLIDALGAKAFCKAYNQWAYEYTKADPDRLFFAALLPMQNPQFAVQEVHRVAAQGCRVALVRPTDAMGNYPLQPKYEPVWNALEETGMVYGMHPFPAGAGLKPPGYSEQYSGAELVRRTMSASGVPHSFLTNVQNFQSEAALWVTTALMTGLFERHPKLTAAVFEASSTWLSFLLDECDKAYRLYRNERSLPPLKKLPSETFRNVLTFRERALGVWNYAQNHYRREPVRFLELPEGLEPNESSRLIESELRAFGLTRCSEHRRTVEFQRRAPVPNLAEASVGTVFKVQSWDRNLVRWEDHLLDLTPVEYIGGMWWKREDKFAPLGGGKGARAAPPLCPQAGC